MGGFGSGGHNRLSDAEKKRRGTYRKDQSSRAHDKKVAEKVVAGPWLNKIPEPTLALDDMARKRYFEIAQHLLDQGALTVMTCGTVQIVALRYAKLQKMLEEGKDPPTYLLNQIEKDNRKLEIAETEAPTIGGPKKRARFAGAGFTQDRTAEITVRRSTASGHRG